MYRYCIHNMDTFLDKSNNYQKETTDYSALNKKKLRISLDKYLTYCLVDSIHFTVRLN